GAIDAVLATARAAGGTARPRLWLCHPSWEQLVPWRRLDDEVRLVDSTRRRRIREGPEVRGATLSREGIDAINLHHTDWTGGLTTLFHRFGRICLGWDAQLQRVLRALLDMGIDGLYSDHVDRMVDAIDRETGAPTV
ncbi:MAG: glycerophosphodiester phosphodiesterase, partial [Actinomycetota bacterium]